MHWVLKSIPFSLFQCPIRREVRFKHNDINVAIFQQFELDLFTDIIHYSIHCPIKLFLHLSSAQYKNIPITKTKCEIVTQHILLLRIRYFQIASVAFNNVRTVQDSSLDYRLACFQEILRLNPGRYKYIPEIIFLFHSVLKKMICEQGRSVHANRVGRVSPANTARRKREPQLSG